MKQIQPTTGQKLLAIIKRADNFGESKTFHIDGQTTFKSFPGACISIVIASLLFVVFLMKSISLVNREEFQFYEIIHKNGLDFERSYSQEETKFFITFQIRSILDNRSLL